MEIKEKSQSEVQLSAHIIIVTHNTMWNHYGGISSHYSYQCLLFAELTVFIAFSLQRFNTISLYHFFFKFHVTREMFVLVNSTQISTSDKKFGFQNVEPLLRGSYSSSHKTRREYIKNMEWSGFSLSVFT